jgi:hypothetical protein
VLLSGSPPRYWARVDTPSCAGVVWVERKEVGCCSKPSTRERIRPARNGELALTLPGRWEFPAGTHRPPGVARFLDDVADSRR